MLFRRSCILWHAAKFIWPKVPHCAVTDVEDPNRLALFIDFTKNPVNPAALAKQETANVSMSLLGLSREGQRFGSFSRVYRESMSSSNHSGPRTGARSTTQS